MQSILEIRDLRVGFGPQKSRVPAVDGISLSLDRGSTTGIVGESGSGKSVTAMTVMRLIPSPPGFVESGEILFHHDTSSVDLLKLTEKQMCHYRGNEIAMVFQEPMTSLNPVYTCGRQVAETLRLHRKMNRRQAKTETLEWFNEVKLPRPESIFHSYPHELSGGQKQRVMIAMAMCCQPSILIADEPTTALDVTIQKTILELMKALQQKYGMSILFITHDLRVVAEIADKVEVMYRGKIVESGTAEEIFRAPQHPYTRGLLACRPKPGKRLLRLPTVSDFMEKAATGKDAPTLENIFEELSAQDTAHAAADQKTEKQPPAFRIENLKTWFPAKRALFSRKTEYIKALDKVSFEVFPGETLGLVGESGCGKTTLGRSLLRLIEPTGGRIFYSEEELLRFGGRKMRQVRKELQIIFQDPYSSLNPRMMIGDALTEPMKVHGIGRNEKERRLMAIEMLKRVSLDESHFYRYPHEFSGGQRQRICIARALVLKPKFIICDESVSALDVSVQAQVLNLLNDLKKDFGITYVFISHDLSVVRFMSNRIIVMQNGHIVEIGDADQIWEHPENVYTKQLIDAIPKGIIYDNR